MSELMTPLETLADEINELHGQITGALRTTVDLAIKCGEKLAKAKADPAIPHGKWSAWLAENFNGSARIAQEWMQLSENRELLETATVADLGVRGSLEHIRKQLKAAKEARDNEAALAQIDKSEAVTKDRLDEIDAALGDPTPPVIEGDPQTALRPLAKDLHAVVMAKVGALRAKGDLFALSAEGSEAAWLTRVLDKLEYLEQLTQEVYECVC